MNWFEKEGICQYREVKQYDVMVMNKYIVGCDDERRKILGYYNKINAKIEIIQYEFMIRSIPQNKRKNVSNVNGKDLIDLN